MSAAARILLLCACLLATLPARADNRPTLVLGAENDAAPWSMADGSGFVNELVRAIYASQGWTLQLEVLPYARCKALVLRGTLAGCFTMSKDAELGRHLLFPRQPVIAPRHQLYVTDGAAQRDCRASAWGGSLRLAQTNGYEYADEANRLVGSGALKAQVVISESTGLRMLAAGRVDAVLLTTDEVKRIEYLAALSGLKQMPRLLCDFGSVPGYLAFSPQHPRGTAALAAFEQGFEQLQKDGSLARLQQSWANRILGAARAASRP